jgi:hypothetical protein
MKRLSFVLVAAVAVGISCSVQAQVRARSIDQICPKVQAAGSESSTIYKQSAPLRAGGIGTPIVGFRKEPTLIFNRRNFAGGRHTIYDSAGNALGSCPVMSAHGHAGRARCTMQTSSLRRAAIKNTRSARIYFKISKNLCVSVADAGRCIGSVKGLCDRLIS